MIAHLKEERKIHMRQQQSCTNFYYTWCKFSHFKKDKYLCIIHDKMDQKKTAIPRLRVNSKDYANAYQLQVSLTGMITHDMVMGCMVIFPSMVYGLQILMLQLALLCYAYKIWKE